jgi:acetolactate synthase-1/2/3 large subunit
MSPAEIPGLVREAFTQLRTGRPRPVELEIPPDVLQRQADVELLPAHETERQAADPALVKQAAEALAKAERPLIFVGSGIFLAEAWDELRELAEMLQAPVVMTRNGRGAISDRHYLAQTSLGGRRLLPDADVVLAVGTRFVEPTTQWGGIKPGVTTIQIDVDPEEVGRNGAPSLGIVGDAKLALRAILSDVDGAAGRRPSREAELRKVQEEVKDLLFEVQPQSDFATAIREALPEDGIVVNESTQVGYWSNMGFPVYEPRTFINSGYQGTLGYGFATALGVKVGNPDKPVVSINGDGGFGYNLQELSTVKAHGINVVAVVFSDNAYGNVKRIQQNTFNGRTIASDLVNPDWVKLAESFGVRGARATSPDDLSGTVREALASNEPVLVEVPVGPMPDPWHLIFPERRAAQTAGRR